jgi:2-phospho-L-lactate guanylyltransferase
MAVALVPLKDLVEAKTRLAGLLRPSERRALAQAMVEDVLAVLASHPEISRVVLLSDDPGAHLLAENYGAEYWPETGFSGIGLNALLTEAAQRLLDQGCEALVILHGDLPLLRAEDITAVVREHRAGGELLIGCDRAGRGTNLLVLDRATLPGFHFGEGSCALHLAAARQAGIPARVVKRQGIGLDVDEPADLVALLPELEGCPERRTARMFSHGGLIERIGPALDSLQTTAEDKDEESRAG